MLYSKNKLAETLFETLDEMKSKNMINNQVKSKIVDMYQKSIVEEIQKKLKPGRIDMKGHLNSYQYVDLVWHFLIQNAEMNGEMHDFHMKLDLIQIIAMDLKCLTPEENKNDGKNKKGKSKIPRKRKSNEI